MLSKVPPETIEFIKAIKPVRIDYVPESAEAQKRGRKR